MLHVHVMKSPLIVRHTHLWDSCIKCNTFKSGNFQGKFSLFSLFEELYTSILYGSHLYLQEIEKFLPLQNFHFSTKEQ